MTWTPPPTLVEELAKAMCADDPDVRMGDPESVVQQRVRVEWPNYVRHAQAILPIIARVVEEDRAYAALQRREALIGPEACVSGWEVDHD